MEPERGPKFQCLLCKKQLSGELDEHFTQHMAWHNVTFNLEFLYATFFLDAGGIERTVEFMLNSATHDKDQPIHSTTPADDGSNPSAEIENIIEEELTEAHTNHTSTKENMESDKNHSVADTDHIKNVEAEILQLKADIYNLKDVFRKYSMYGKFLAAISPEDWRKEQEAIREAFD